MQIRKMQNKDRAQVFEMMRVFYDSPAVLHETADEILRKDIEDCLGDCPYITGYVFEENEQYAGYAMVATGYSTEYGGVCLWIEDLYVCPEFRGTGIGRTFISSLEKEYRGHVVRLRLEVETENERAVKVYSAGGYVKSRYAVMDRVPE